MEKQTRGRQPVYLRFIRGLSAVYPRGYGRSLFLAAEQ